MRFVDERLILENHYEWCKKEGRDTSWYTKYKQEENELLEPTKIKRVKRKRVQAATYDSPRS